MINFRLINKILGSLLFIEAFLMLWCLVMSIVYRQSDTFAFGVALAVTIAAGCILRYYGRNANNMLSRRDSYLVVTLAWCVFSLFGTLPFLVGGFLTNFTDAFFETMSGFTTTGATIFDDVERLPRGILFWRSLMQWIGGLGIVFFTIAILPSFVGGSVKIFSAEATGPIRTKLHPRLSVNTKALWLIFFVLTLACIVTYRVLGMNWFDSVNYAMTTCATGGFAPHNDSILHFQSAGIEYACIVFCFLGGVNFTMLYLALIKFQFKKLTQNSEFKCYLWLIIGVTLFIMAALIVNNGYNVERAFRSSLFQTISTITTTGLFNDDIALWPQITWIILFGCMFIGACSGSTSSGWKCIRVVMLLKIVRNEFRQLLHPNAILPLKVNKSNVPMQQRVRLLALLTIYLLLFSIAVVLITACGVDFTNALAISMSSMSNVGPSLAIEIGPSISWSELPVLVKWLCTALMLMGRLEIFSVLVIFTHAFWKEN